MAGFLYFIPDAAGCNPEILKRFELDDRLDIEGLTYRKCDGAWKGLIVGYAKDRTIGYFPDQQEWHEVPGADYRIGRWLNAPIMPADLARPNQRPGHAVELGDGHGWIIPLAKIWPAGTSAFPEKLVMGPDREWTSEPCEPYIGICEQADRVWRRFQIDAGLVEPQESDAQAEPLDFEDAIEIAIQALAVNYRIGPFEASVLGLLTTTSEGTVTKALEAFIGLPDLVAVSEALAAAKKNGGPVKGLHAGTAIACTPAQSPLPPYPSGVTNGE